MKFDLHKFKKVNSDKNSTTLAHPDGHKITIAHAALSPKMRSQLAELPGIEAPGVKMADGGEVADNKKKQVPGGNGSPSIDQGKAESFQKDFQKPAGQQLKEGWENAKKELGFADGGEVPQQQDQAAAPQAPVTINIGNPTQQGALPQNLINPNPGAQAMAQNPPMDIKPSTPYSDPSALPYGVTPEMASAPAAPQQAMPETPAQPAATPPAQAPQQGSSDPFGTQAYSDAAMKGINEQKAGMLGQANAMGQQGQQEAAMAHKAAADQQSNLDNFQSHMQHQQTEYDNFIKDIQNQHIDPNRFMSSKGTMGKIGTMIGLVLGGMGAGLGRTSNQAADWLNTQISRDIDAQKSELGKKENLLSASLKQTGNLRDASAMTQALMNGVVSMQFKQAAAQASSPMAKAQALQAAGKLDFDSASLLSQIAMRKTLLGGMQSGTVNPERVVNLLIPEHQRAEANKELKEAQGMVAARDNILGAFNQLKDLNTVGNRAAHLGFTPASVAALRDPIIAGLSKETAGRFTESDAKMVGALFPSPGDSEQTQAVKLQQLSKLINEKMHFPILSTYGIDANKMGRFNGQGASRIQESAPVLKK